MYECGVPICILCSNANAKRKPPQTDQQIRASLLRDVIEATSRNNEASKEFENVMGQFPGGLPYPGGAQRIKNASSRLSASRNKMMQAHTRLNNYLGHGIVPEDLKRSG